MNRGSGSAGDELGEASLHQFHKTSLILAY